MTTLPPDRLRLPQEDTDELLAWRLRHCDAPHDRAVALGVTWSGKLQRLGNAVGASGPWWGCTLLRVHLYGRIRVEQVDPIVRKLRFGTRAEAFADDTLRMTPVLHDDLSRFAALRALSIEDAVAGILSTHIDGALPARCQRRETLMENTMTKFAAACASAMALVLAGCGGGGDTQETADQGTSPEGVYGGTISGATTSAFQMLILDDGELWALYGTQGTSVFYVRGFIQGKGSWSQGSYSATDVRDFGSSPPPAGRLAAGFNAAAGTISGTVTDGVGTVSFSGGPIPGSLYRYNAAASLASVAGSWTLTELGGQTLATSIGADGRFSATGSGCTMSGTLTPRPSGKNVFNVALTFGPAPCQLPLQPAKGIAVLTPLATGQSQLIVAATDIARSAGAAAFGTR